MEFIPAAAAAAAAWASSRVCPVLDMSPHPLLRGLCDDIDLRTMKQALPPSAQVYARGSAKYAEAAWRWSSIEAPSPKYIVVPASEEAVVETIKYANAVKEPFLAITSGHGTMRSLSGLQDGIGIYLKKLSSVGVSEDGSSVRIGGGATTKQVTDTLWKLNKQTVTGACECTGYVGPGLGGGHGFLQGRHGLVGDQWESANVVFGNGTLATIDAGSDLFWAMNGAGHNFGIVTSVTAKVYDVETPNWAHETFFFAGDKVEQLYELVNKHHLKKDKGEQPVDLINWSYMLNVPEMHGEPVVVMFVLQEGVYKVDRAYTQPLHDLGPLSSEASHGTYLDLPRWTGIDVTGPPCQKKTGLANLRYPIEAEAYNPASVKKMYDRFAAVAHQYSPLNASMILLEGYSTQGVKAVSRDATAYAFRDDNLLISPLIVHEVGNKQVHKAANALGEELRGIIHAGTGRENLRAYVNYAFPNDTPRRWYGYDKWRLAKLKKLKQKYDPEGKFSFFGPIA